VLPRCHLLTIGRFKSASMQDVFTDYAMRLRPPLKLRELELRRPLPAGTQSTTAEADLLLAALPEGAALVALTVEGEALSSQAFAQRLARYAGQGGRDVAFCIGGADGLAPTLTQRALWSLSLGAMVWPHLLVRVMLAEQLYRAQQILAGHPYHRA
jgi:23S rRNA (pseudouridine1915-N3)-methyltransferase